MDGLTFISKLVEALAWPIVVLVGILLFKPKLSALLSQLTGLKIGGAELQFEQAAQNALVEVIEIEKKVAPAELPAPSANDVADEEADLDYQKYYATSQPVAAVLTSWNRIENAVNSILAEKAPVPRGRARSAGARFNVLRSLKLIPDDQLTVLNELRELRNKVAHGMSVSPTAALAFVESADRLVRILQSQE